MGSSLNSIVNVNILLQNAAVQTRGFGRGLILGSSNKMGSDLYRVYSSYESVLDDFATTDKEAIAALKYFSQAISPVDVMIGYAPTSAVAQVEEILVATVTNNFNYTVTVNGETATYLSDGSATAAEIVAGLVSAINALTGAAAFTAAATSGSTDRLHITSDVAGTPFTLALGTTKLTMGQYELLTVVTATDSFEYEVIINGQSATYTSDSSATVAEIAAGLITAINALTGVPVTATAVSTDKIALTADVAADPFTFSHTVTKITSAGTTRNAVGGVANGLSAIVDAGGKDWYALIMTESRAKADILEAAAWIEAATFNYIYIACSSDADVLTSVTSDVLSALQALSYLRTAYMWSDDQANFPEAAWFGLLLPTVPGSTNYAYKTLVGITATALTVLTDSKLAILIGKGGNYYVTVAGVPITQNGAMVGGQWIDVVVGRDWIQANIEEGVFGVLVNTPKVDFTDAGIGLLANAVRNVLQLAINNGILASFVLDPPLASSFSAAQRQTRVLPNLNWTAALKGAIDNVTITGIITS